MKSKNKRIIEGDLNALVERFSQQNIVAEIEKRYQSAPAKLLPISSIDDVPVIASVAIPKNTIEYYAKTLQEKGFYNALVVRPRNDGRYEIILGRKRFYGAKAAGIVSLPCTFAEVGDEEMLLMLLADCRDQREGNVIEMALICDKLKKDFGYKQDTLAEISHQSRCQISNIHRLLTLPSPIQKDICLKKLSYGHARSLVGLAEEEALALSSRIQKEGLSVRECEKIVQAMKAGEKDAPSKPSFQIDGKTLLIDFSNEEELLSFVEKNLK